MEENRSWLVLFMQTMRTRREGCYGGLSNLGMKESTDLRSGAGQICASRLNSEVKWNLISGFASIMFLRTWFGIAYEKNQLSGFQGIKFPWKPTLSGSIEYHGPPRSGHLSFP